MFVAIWNSIWPDGHGPKSEEAAKISALAGLAARHHLDMEKFLADSESEECTQWIQTSVKEKEIFGVESIPKFFINGRYSERVELDKFRELIDNRLEQISFELDQQEREKTMVAVGSGQSLPRARVWTISDYYQRFVMEKGVDRAKMTWPFDLEG